MKQAESVTFGGSALNRAAELRGDNDVQAELLRDPSSGVMAIWRGKPLLSADRAEVSWHPADHPVFNDCDPETVFLGLDDGAPRFARTIRDWPMDDVAETLGAFHDPSEQTHPAVGNGHVFSELRAKMTQMSPRTAELIATAKAVLGWHQTHRFCSKCGAPTSATMAGWQRDCDTCDGKHFPRTDPVVIMLILRGNSVLVGRSPGWPDGMYSLLAGFVEPGETIEAAVRREVFEEAGIRVGEVGYLSSQPWPFPSSLMFGCIGFAETEEITLDPNELEDAIWVTREEMVEAMAGRHDQLKPARPGAIARFLIDAWLADALD